MNEADITIRDMTRGDLGAALALMRQLGYEVPLAELGARFERVNHAEGHHLFAAERAGHVAGLLHVFARPALEKPVEAIVQSMVVDETARRAGIGRALMAAAESWALGEGLASVALSSQLKREDAHAFYESLGYRRVATSGLLRKQL